MKPDSSVNSAPFALAVIPARYGSRRLPGKALIELGGAPIALWVARAARKMSTVARIIIATDDERIARVAAAEKIESIMTPTSISSGSDRVALVAESIDEYDYIINLQGDEPFIDPAAVDEAALFLRSNRGFDVATLFHKLDRDRADDPNIVKTLRDANGAALYFSRSKIPYEPDASRVDPSPYLAHIGLYVFRREYLLKFAKMEPSRLERIEGLEQLRIIERGDKIALIESGAESIGIDTPADLKRAEKFLRRSGKGE